MTEMDLRRGRDIDLTSSSSERGLGQSSTMIKSGTLEHKEEDRGKQKGGGLGEARRGGDAGT